MNGRSLVVESEITAMNVILQNQRPRNAAGFSQFYLGLLSDPLTIYEITDIELDECCK